MRITKRQLKRIIKEEKAKLLEVSLAKRSQGLYSDVSSIDALHRAFDDLLVGTNEAAYGDLGDDWEADMASEAAVTLAVAEMFQSAGMIGQYQKLMETLR
jgi:hypothetical protein